MPDNAHDSLVRCPEQVGLPGSNGTLTRPGSSYGKSLLGQKDRARPRPPFECIALVLQGGRALGSYQAGVYQALFEANLQPDWVAGIAIGASNAAIIAGNAPEKGLEMLRGFWESITAAAPSLWWSGWLSDPARGERARSLVNQMNAVSAVTGGAAGFFELRVPPPGCTQRAAWRRPASMRQNYSGRPLSASSTSTASMPGATGSALGGQCAHRQIGLLRQHDPHHRARTL